MSACIVCQLAVSLLQQSASCEGDFWWSMGSEAQNHRYLTWSSQTSYDSTLAAELVVLSWSQLQIQAISSRISWIDFFRWTAEFAWLSMVATPTKYWTRWDLHPVSYRFELASRWGLVRLAAESTGPSTHSSSDGALHASCGRLAESSSLNSENGQLRILASNPDH